MKILALKPWQAFSIICVPFLVCFFISYIFLINNIQDGKYNTVITLIGVFLMLISIYIWHILIGQAFKEILGDKLKLSYLAVWLCILVNFMSQILYLFLGSNELYPILLIFNFSTYGYILLFTIKNTYYLEDIYKIPIQRNFWYDFIYVWTLPYGIWKFQKRLNLINEYVLKNPENRH